MHASCSRVEHRWNDRIDDVIAAGDLKGGQVDSDDDDDAGGPPAGSPGGGMGGGMGGMI